MEHKAPPKNASGKGILSICDILIDEEMTREELYEESEQVNSTIRANLSYGKSLSFIEEDDDGTVKLSNLGKKAGFSFRKDDEESISEYFIEGISNGTFFQKAISKLIEGDEMGDTLTKDEVAQIFFTSEELDVSGNMDTVESKTTTFLKTLESAGLGEYKKGSGGEKGSRLILNDRFDSVYQELFVDEEEVGTDIEEDATIQRKEVPRYQPQPTQQATEQGISFDISLELSGDEDPEQIEELVASVRRGMRSSVEENKKAEDESTEADESKEDVSESKNEIGEDESETKKAEENGSPESSEEGTEDEEEDEKENKDSESSSSLDAFND